MHFRSGADAIMSSSEDLQGEVMQVNAVAEAVQDVTVATFASQLGWMSTVWHGGRLAGLSFGHRSAAAARRSLGITPGEEEQRTADMRQVVQRLQRFARGGRDEFLDVAIDLGRRTRFQRAVLEQCRRIPLGQVWTYGQLAAQVGSPGAGARWAVCWRAIDSR